MKQPFFILFLLLFITYSTQAVRYPVSPSEPNLPGDTNPNDKKNKAKLKNIVVQVKLKLGSGDELDGTILMPEKLTFSHYKNGLTYSKTISPAQIKKITVNEYSSRKGTGDFFEFEPQSITLVTTDGREFIIQGIFSFLRKITIETPDGTTTVYTFFADSWNEKTGWREVASKDRQYHRKNPHPQAVKEINVLGTPAFSGDRSEEE